MWVLRFEIGHGLWVWPIFVLVFQVFHSKIPFLDLDVIQCMSLTEVEKPALGCLK